MARCAHVSIAPTRLLTAFVAVIALAITSVVVGMTVHVSAAHAATPGQGSPFDCYGGTIYNIQRGATNSTLNALDTSTLGSASVTDTPIATLPNQANPNALGITRGGSAAYTVQQSTGAGATSVPLYGYDTTTQAWTTYTGTAGANDGFVAGAVDPFSGIYYYANYANAVATIYGFDTTTSTPIPGVIASINLPLGTAGAANGDIAFDQGGNLYLVESIGTSAAVGVVRGPLPTTGNNTSLTDTVLQNYSDPTSAGYNGIAFDNFGHLFIEYAAGTTSTLVELNPNTGAVIAGPTPQSTTGTLDVDLAACSLNPTLSVQKDVVSRSAPSDEFGLSITGGGIAMGNTATTTGSATGIQAATAGPVIGVSGTAYTVSETAASGSLANYVSTYSCIDQADGGNVVASGAGSSFVLSFPNPAAGRTGAYVMCTFTNTAIPAALDTIKAVTTVNGGAATSATQINAGDVVGYAITVTNTGGSAGTTTLTDVVPAGTTYSGTGEGWSCAAGSAAATPCTQPVTVAAGTAITEAYTVTVDNPLTGVSDITNSVTSSVGTCSACTAVNPIPAAPAVSLTKTATVNPPADQTDPKLGDVVTYSFAVTNTGSSTLTTLTVTDPADGGAVACPAPGGGLLPTDTVTCTGTTSYAITQADIDAGSRTDTATATGTDAGANTSAPASSTAILAIPSAASLTLAKTSTTSAVSVLGFVITYQFAVTNTGNVTLSGVGVSDTQLAPSTSLTTAPACQSLATPAGACAGAATTLLPGQVADFTATYTVTQADLDNGSVSDFATATGVPPQQPGGPTPTPVTAQSPTLKIPTLQFPVLTLVKSATTASVAAVGDVITYDFVATNTGNVTLSGVGIADSQISPSTTLTSAPVCQSLAGPSAVCSGATTTLVPGQSATFTATYTVTQLDLDNGSVNDSATAGGTPPLIPGGVVPQPITSNISNATVTATQQPALSIVKSWTPTTVDTVGQVITYQFLVTNNGNVTLIGVAVADVQAAPAGALTTAPVCQSLAGPAGSCAGATTTLAPGQSATFTATYTVTQLDLDNGSVNDSATSSGTPPQIPGGPTVQPITSLPSSLTVPVTQSATLTLLKSASPTTVAASGTAVSYSFLVTNTGNVTIGNLAVSDAMASPALNSGVSAISCPVSSLAPAVFTTCTASYVTTQADANNGSIVNTATASGTPPQLPGGPVPTPVFSPTSTATVTVTQSPSLSLVKSANISSFNAAGQTITYTFAVSNTGNVTLGSLTVIDTVTAPATQANLSAISCPVTSLNPAASTSCTATYLTSQLDVDNGSIANSAVVSGLPPQLPGGPTPVPVSSSPSTATVPGASTPSMTLVKTATTIDVNGDSTIGVGDHIAYGFMITDTGNTTLTGLSVSDPALGSVTCPSGPLAPGVSATCTGDTEHVITQADVDAGNVDNTAVSDASTGCPLTTCPLVTSNPSSADVALAQLPSLGLVTAGAYAAGHVTWTVTVTNTGDVTLSGVVVSDPAAGGVTCPTTALAPGASMVCTSLPRLATAAEFAAGSATNAATAIAGGFGLSTVTESSVASAKLSIPRPLAQTGTPIGQLVGLALALLITGLSLLVLAPRRRA